MPKLQDLSVNPFDAPIPGQSLTDEPGSSPWEQPPQYTDIEEALDHMLTQLMRPKNYKKMVALLDEGVPAEAVARAALFSGFMQGFWTIDMMTLMAKPALQTIVVLGEMAGVDVKLGIPKRYKGNSMLDAYRSVSMEGTDGAGGDPNQDPSTAGSGDGIALMQEQAAMQEQGGPPVQAPMGPQDMGGFMPKPGGMMQ